VVSLLADNVVLVAPRIEIQNRPAPSKKRQQPNQMQDLAIRKASKADNEDLAISMYRAGSITGCLESSVETVQHRAYHIKPETKQQFLTV
jgi:hypothetical protein